MSGKSPALSRRKSVVFRLLALGVALGLLVVVFGVAELALRIRGGAPGGGRAEPAEEFLACEKDPVVGWIFPASTEGEFRRGVDGVAERTNEFGLRSPPVRVDEPGITRILVIGDSFAFGWGVTRDEAFPRRLEEVLRERHPDRRIEVVNAGIPGYSLYQQRALLDRLSRDFRVDAVVSTFSLSNDMVDEMRIRRYAPDSLLAYTPRPLDPDSRLARIIAKSRVLTWIDLRTRALQFQVANVSPTGIRRAEESLEGILSICRERDLPVLLVLLPRRIEIESGGLREWFGRWMTGRARRMYEDVAAREGISVVDVTRALEAVEQREPGSAYLPNDPHWTPEGHEAVTAAIVDSVDSLAVAR